VKPLFMASIAAAFIKSGVSKIRALLPQNLRYRALQTLISWLFAVIAKVEDGLTFLIFSANRPSIRIAI